MFSSSTNSSSSTLAPQKPPKNYEAAFGTLASSYGFAGGVPILRPSLSSSKKSTTRDTPSLPRADPKPRNSAQQPKQKDYEAAYGTLASSYGFGWPLPAVATKSKKRS